MSDLDLGSSNDVSKRVLLNSDHLTTHAVCLGMTGSGKTGLGIVALEELAAAQIPLLIIDLKGDMVDLLLNFPDFNPADFKAWLPPDSKRAADPESAAVAAAETWKKGLESSGITPARMLQTKTGIRWRLLTPGYASGAPLDILPSLSAPAGWKSGMDPDGDRQRVDGLVSALLSLIDRHGDPLSDPDHVLLSSILLALWERAEKVDLAGLLGAILDPPMETLGALPLETFYPRDRRMKLVMALNTLLASPSFKVWTEGVPLDMNVLLGTADQPCGSIVSLAHLEEKQRLFCITLLASELVSWMRSRPASAGLSALMYIDEVQGILPPHPANPPTKHPLMTILKQGRAFGVGLWLATQNPVDLDYKAMGNAGIKMIGRLITEGDRDRALEGLGLKSTEEGVDIEKLVTKLEKRQFLFHDVRAKERIRVLSSRWAMSYLRGPITLAEMAPLFSTHQNPELTESSMAQAEEIPGPDVHATAARPPLIDIEIAQLFAASGGALDPSLLIRNTLTVIRAGLSLDRSLEESWQIPIDDSGEILWEQATELEDEPDSLEVPPPNATFPRTVPSKLATELKKAKRDFIRWRARKPLLFLSHPKLKCVAEIGETREDFIARCREMADRADDTRQERVRSRFERKILAAKKRLAREQDELERDQKQLEAREAEEKLGVVEGLFSVLLGSRSLRSAAGKAGAKLRSASTKRRLRQVAEGSVIESEKEIDRIKNELEELAEEMQEEIESIAEASDSMAEQVEEVAVRAKQANINPSQIHLFWS